MMYLLKGLLIGLLFGIPVGAVGTLTLARTINYDSIRGFITGLGSSVADIFYACVGVFGVSLISDFLLDYQIFINIVGSIFILTLGVTTFRKKEIIKQESKQGLIKMFLSSFVIGITNPATILSFIFAFSYMKIGEDINMVNGALLVFGVFLGTLIWWSILVIIGNFIKKKISNKKIEMINKIFGILLIIFGIVILINILI